MAFSELARPWRTDGHSSAAPALLLCHGFTGTPQSMRPWGEHHASHGWAVDLPLLPGHASTWQEMARTAWTQWYETLRSHALELSDRHGPIAVGGLSMGGALTLHLAADPGLRERIGAIVLVNPALSTPLNARFAPLIAPFTPTMPAIASDIADPSAHEEAYDRTPLRAVTQLTRLLHIVRGELDRVTAPLLLATSPADGVVDPRSSDRIAAGVSGPVERMRLTRSRHVATLDYDAQALFDRSLAFLAPRIGAPGA